MPPYTFVYSESIKDISEYFFSSRAFFFVYYFPFYSSSSSRAEGSFAP